MIEQSISILQKNNIICVMSVTISTCQQICKNPVNNSPSKMLYSFPKSTRFQCRKMIYCDKYYEIPSTVASCRTTTFGVGQKYDFTQDAPKNPPPNTYDISSTFTARASQGFGFGKGREEMEATGPLCSVRTNKNPGPGAYEAANPASKTSYSIGVKWHEQDGQKEIPGPGTYPLTFSISQSGNYFLSKHKSSCVRNFSKMGGRIESSPSRIPGPGAYNTTRADLSPNGRYPSSKMQNCLTRKFPISNRRPIAENNENPGPGNYRLPSQFGQYTSKRAFLQQNQNKISSKNQKTAKTEQTRL